MALQDIHVWLGRLVSSQRREAYLESSYNEDRDDLPLNEFASGQARTSTTTTGSVRLLRQSSVRFSAGLDQEVHPPLSKRPDETLSGDQSLAQPLMDGTRSQTHTDTALVTVIEFGRLNHTRPTCGTCSQ